MYFCLFKIRLKEWVQSVGIEKCFEKYISKTPLLLILIFWKAGFGGSSVILALLLPIVPI